jgi:hypothetical protein
MSKKQKPLSQKEVEALIGHPVEWGGNTNQD